MWCGVVWRGVFVLLGWLLTHGHSRNSLDWHTDDSLSTSQHHLWTDCGCFTRRAKRSFEYRKEQYFPISKTSVWSLSFLIAVGFVLYLWGCIVYIYRVINERGNVEVNSSSYAIWTIGRDLPLSAVDGGKGMFIWLEIIWYTLGMAIPLMSSVCS
jgi:hypothetical protein